MNIQEAYKILECDSNISDEDLAKKFKKLAAKNHPDVNKEAGALEKSKQISEAFNFIKQYRERPPSNPQINMEDFVGGGFGGFPFHDIFDMHFQNARGAHPSPEDIHLATEISFQESILGVSTPFTFFRAEPCEPCGGEGSVVGKDTCGTCQGKGQVEKTINFGNRVAKQRMVCVTCHGKGKKSEECKECKGYSFKKTEKKVTITIPPGVDDKQKLRLTRVGNYGHGQYSDVYVTVNVKNNTTMKKSGFDVISDVKISLYEALTGVKKEVETIQGSRWIEIPSLNDSKYSYTMNGFGVKDKGNHIFTVIIDFAKDKDKILEKVTNKDKTNADANPV